VLFAAQRAGELGRGRREHLDAAAVESGEPRAPVDHVERGALAAARLGEEQRPRGELESCEPELARQLRVAVAPAKAPGDHEMEHEEELALEREHETLADA